MTKKKPTEPTEAEMKAASKKALDLLFQGMSKDELLAFHLAWDSDPGHTLFWDFSERLAKLAPEHFVTPAFLKTPKETS